MPDEKEKFVPTCPLPMDSLSTKVPMGNVTTDGIATLSQQEFGPITANINALNADVQMLDEKHVDLRSAVENRPKDMEARIDVTHTQVGKMDEFREHLHDESQRY